MNPNYKLSHYPKGFCDYIDYLLGDLLRGLNNRRDDLITPIQINERNPGDFRPMDSAVSDEVKQIVGDIDSDVELRRPDSYKIKH